MKKFLNITFISLMTLLLCFSTKINIYAGGISASASSSSVKVGDTFSVTVRSSGMMVEGLNAVCSGCTLLSGVSRATLDTGESQTVTARLDSSQGATVTFSGNGADYDTETEGPVSASAYVSAKAETTKPSTPSNNTPTTPTTPQPEAEPEEDTRSKDNTLKSLSVSEGTLSPKFSKNTTSYKVDLPADATSITVKATANDSKASVSGTGEIKLSAGNNEVNVVVTSEYGTKKTYTINVYVDEKPLIYTEYNGEKLGVVRNVNGVKVPENFKKITTKLDGEEITAWTNEKMNKTIVYLSDEDNNKNFYLFEDGKVTSKFEYVEMLGRHFYLIDVPNDKQEMAGLKYGELTIDDTKLMGWTFEDKAFENFQIFMAMDMSGETRYYQYEKSENTIQLYSGAATVTQEAYQEQTDLLENTQQQRTIWMVVAIVSLAGLACAGGFYLWKKQSKSKDSK